MTTSMTAPGLDLYALDDRAVAALTAENTGPWEDRIAAIAARCKAAGYDVPDEHPADWPALPAAGGPLLDTPPEARREPAA